MSRPDFAYKVGDLEPALAATLTSNGVPASLVGALEVDVEIRDSAGALLVSDSAEFVDAARGRVAYALESGITASPGTFRVTFSVLWAPGRVQSFPPSGALIMEVEPE